MYIIVGLGNPGKKYDHSRHNIGFETIDYIAEQNDIIFSEKKKKAWIGKGYIEGQKVVLVKPQTFMNLSGESVREVVDFYKVDTTSELLVIYDDISLPVGKLRVRKSGTAGGHNGIKNIIANLGDKNFCRVKMGVGEKPVRYDLADYVLGHFSKEDMKVMQDSMIDVERIVRLTVQGKIDQAMNDFNRKVVVEE
jgi:PTH1 family peptidyl-tRNA hydrolase